MRFIKEIRKLGNSAGIFLTKENLELLELELGKIVEVEFHKMKTVETEFQYNVPDEDLNPEERKEFLRLVKKLRVSAKERK